MIRQLAVPPFDRLEPFLPQPSVTDSATRNSVTEILADVAARRDQAIQEWTLRLDGFELPPARWELGRSEWENALERLDLELREALETAVFRVREYHRKQLDRGFQILQEDGSLLGMRVTPLDRVGLYVPGGKAAYPSSVVMNAVPASVAGVEEIIAVTPPGGITDAVLAACLLSGVNRLFQVGGAQAIAGLAYGTATIPRVDKIVGPGNKWVTEAKRQVAGAVGIDMIAGPTEILVIADSTARPELVAADLVAQAEHDEDASAWCVTTDSDLADRLPRALEDVLSRNSRAPVARAALERNGLIVWVPTIQDAVEVANRRAPEHLEIYTRDPDTVAEGIRHAGAIFLGRDTPEPVGDYLAGPSHVLPTGGTARYASPLGVYDFVKRTSVIGYTRDRLNADAARIIALATAERLPGHAEAVRLRVEQG
ncbi:MAG TPA: histidinol dehydrogenase [Gemmatimonadales bacterium]|jgi:histidinol dehydrogenase|nr:histidinol dehydrogenase [Gemmatimonadales bacterium]